MPPSSNHRGIVWVVAVLCALCAWCGVARGQDGHGWFVIETLTREKATKAVILHVPPEDRMSPRGTVRVVQGLNRTPERLTWSGSELFVLMPRERVPGAAESYARRVYTIAATPGLMSGWEYVPPDRPESMVSIAGEWGTKDVDVIGWAAAPRMPAALVRRGVSILTLLVLTGTTWTKATLPWEVENAAVPPPEPSDRCTLMTTASSFGVLVERPGESEAWWHVASEADVRAIPPEPKGTARLRWTSRMVHSAPPAGAARGTVYCVENQLLRVTPTEGDAVIISVLHASRETVVATMTDVGSNLRVAPVEGRAGFLALLGDAKVDPARAVEVAPYILTEITPSGRPLYQGPARQGGPVSPRDMQMLAVLLVMIMAAVIVFVLRPDKSTPSSAISLPAGFIPAESGRRVMASVLDLCAAWIIGSLIVRLDLGDVARPDILLGTTRGLMAAGAAAAVAIGLGTVLEWQFGMSLGKLLLGCRVLSVRRRTPEEGQGEDAGTPQRGPDGTVQQQAVGVEGVSFGAALARNLGKWTPWNIVEFLATGRQRPWADRISGTMVVVMDGSDQEEKE